MIDYLIEAFKFIQKALGLLDGEFWAAIAGATVGGSISYALQKAATKAAKQQRDDEHLLKMRMLGYALIFKMTKVFSNLFQFHKHLDDTFKTASSQVPPLQPCQVAVPIANFPERIYFSTEEMAMLLSLKDNDLFNLIVSFDAVHNSHISLLETHRELRNAFIERLPAPYHMEETVGTSELSQSQLATLMPKIIELNSLLTQMNVQFKQDYELADEALKKLESVLNKNLELKISLRSKVTVPNPE